MLWLDADFFEAYTHFSSVPWVTGVLEPKVKELIYTAFDVSATHLYISGFASTSATRSTTAPRARRSSR